MGTSSSGLVRVCAECGQKNRVPAAKLSLEGRCGACKASLPALAEPLDVGGDEFAAIVESARVPVLVDFWAEWCSPCRMAAPHVEGVAREMSGRAIVLKVDTEAHPDLARRFDIRGIPSFVVLREGSVVSQQAGLVDQSALRGWLESAGA